MANKCEFPATINANLAIRIPSSARAKLDLKKGDLLTVEIRKEVHNHGG